MLLRRKLVDDAAAAADDDDDGWRNVFVSATAAVGRLISHISFYLNWIK